MSDDPDAPLAPFPFMKPGSAFSPVDRGLGALSLYGTPADPSGDRIKTADADDLPTAEAPRPQTGPLIAQPLLALGRFAFPPEPPTDDEGLSARDRRWASRTIVIAAGFLLIFNAVSIQNWSRQQAPGWVTTTVRRLADVWVEQIAQLGADQPREVVRDGYEAARDGA